MKNINTNTATVITEAARIVAMKSLKTTYSHTGVELFRPSIYNELYEELTSIATVAILETMRDTDIDSFADNEEIFSCDEIIASAYKAINAYIYSLRKDVKMRLYSIDESGNVENTSYNIERMMVTFGDILKRNLRPVDLRIIKYLSLGYTNETITKRMHYKNKRSADKAICITRKNAKAILESNGYTFNK